MTVPRGTTVTHGVKIPLLARFLNKILDALDPLWEYPLTVLRNIARSINNRMHNRFGKYSRKFPMPRLIRYRMTDYKGILYIVES